ncbi:MAG TPA: methyltransferase [Acidocella sp.]|nr:methyltransferase [Acidocella sp.]
MHNVFSVIAGIDATVCFSAFSWGVQGHFRSTGAMPLGMKVTSALSMALFAGFLWNLTHGLGGAWFLSIVLFTASLGVFATAILASRRTPPTLAYDNDSPNFLLNHGPYRYVRHPFYLAYVLFWLGTAIAVHSVAGWVAPVLMTALYVDAATREERKFATSELAAAYAAYRARAGMFWPRPLVLLAG